MVRYNDYHGIISKDFNTISSSSTVSDWVDAFNNNAVAGEYLNEYLGDMLFNGMLFDPQNVPTIGGVEIASLTNIDLTTTGASPNSLELDNFFLYFRDLNKIIALDHVTFDLSDYNDSEPHLFFINSSLGFRVSQTFEQHDDELCLFRFIINPNLTFAQCYVTAQRFGTSVYDASGEYFEIQGCTPLPMVNKHLKLDNGFIKRSGVKFDYHLSPDLYKVIDDDTPFNIRYITTDNTVDFSIVTPGNTVIDNKVLNYSTGVLSTISSGFTAQRILYDIYSNCLVIQYGDTVFSTIDEALSSVDNVTYDFPYSTIAEPIKYRPMFIPIGLMFIKADCTDLRDTEQCILMQQTSMSVTQGQTVFFAEDAYARGKIEVLSDSIAAAVAAANDAVSRLTSHVGNPAQNHPVTKATIGLANVQNYSYTEIKDMIANDTNGLGNKWIKKDVADSTTGLLTLNGGVVIPATYNSGARYLDNKGQFIQINSLRLYLGVRPDNAPDGSWSISK